MLSSGMAGIVSWRVPASTTVQHVLWVVLVAVWVWVVRVGVLGVDVQLQISEVMSL